MARRTLGIATLAGAAALIAVLASVFFGVPPARAVPVPTQVTLNQTTAPPAPTTTIAPLGNSLPVSPVTLALRTRGSNAHVDPVFAILSGIGFFVALVIVCARLIVTRSGGSDRRPDPDPDPDRGGTGWGNDPVWVAGQGPASSSS